MAPSYKKARIEYYNQIKIQANMPKEYTCENSQLRYYQTEFNRLLKGILLFQDDFTYRNQSI